MVSAQTWEFKHSDFAQNTQGIEKTIQQSSYLAIKNCNVSFEVPKNLENLHLPSLVKILTDTNNNDRNNNKKCRNVEMSQKLELASIQACWL